MEDIRKLEKQEEARRKLRLPLQIKPCLGILIDDTERIKEGINAFICATELYRVGRTKEQIERILDSHNIEPSKLRSAIKSGVSGKYSYGCPRLEELGLCQFRNRSECWWYQRIPKKNWTNFRERDFWRFHWPKKMKSTKAMLYLSVREIEKKRRIRAGSWVFIAYEELSRVSGVNPSSIKKSLEGLQKEGLIEFRVGKKRTRGAKVLATQIKRIVPIPRPS